MKRKEIANENFDKLPNECFGILPSSGEIIGIIKGEKGYRPQYEGFTQQSIERWNAKNAEEAVDALNEFIGVNKAQRRAMENGSMFGWHTKGADPEEWAAREK